MPSHGLAVWWRWVCGVALLSSLFFGPPVDAQTVDPHLWGADDLVTAIARSGNTLYIGGSFTSVGPATGGGVPLNLEDGAPRADFPKVTGTVYGVAPDGAGGWYVGGAFTLVGGVPRSNLAHILADGTVGSWDPSANRSVFRLVVNGSIVYVGGLFATIGGESRSYLAALDAASGRALPWNPTPNAAVWALAVEGDRVYVGGLFTTIGGRARNYIAALDTVSGAALDWNPNADYWVADIATSGNVVYVGGYFSTIGGQARNLIAAVDAGTGAATTFDANASGIVSDYLDTPRVATLALSGDILYAGGVFTEIGGAPRHCLAALDATSGAATSWSPGIGPSYSRVYALALNGNLLYAGGWFTFIGGEARNHVAALDIASGAATSWNPRANDAVYAVGVEGNSVYAGGVFTSMWDWEPRARLAALDATTGALKPWNPDANSSVISLAVKDSTVYVGGKFTSIGGQPRSGIAALDTLTGAPTSWNPDSNGPVECLLVTKTTVYAGGEFTQMGGQVRSNLAGMDRVTGAVTGWDPRANSSVYALQLVGGTIYVGGYFTRIGGGGVAGHTRNGLAAIDTITGAVTDWDPDTDGWVNALAVSGNTIYVGGLFGRIGGSVHQSVAAVDLDTGTAIDWNPLFLSNESPYPEVRALAVNDTTIWMGGRFSTVNGLPRYGLAEVGVAGGGTTAWDPDADGQVWCLTAHGNTVYAGGRFTKLRGLPATNLAAIVTPEQRPAPIPPSLVLEQSAPNPAEASTLIRFSLPAAGPVNLNVYDLQGRRIARLLDHEPRTAGLQEVVVQTGAWRPGCYIYRLEANGKHASRKMVVIK